MWASIREAAADASPAVIASRISPCSRQQPQAEARPVGEVVRRVPDDVPDGLADGDGEVGDQLVLARPRDQHVELGVELVELVDRSRPPPSPSTIAASRRSDGGVARCAASAADDRSRATRVSVRSPLPVSERAKCSWKIRASALPWAGAIRVPRPGPVLEVISPCVCSTRMASRTAERPTPELGCEVTLGRQLLAGAERAGEDAGLDVAQHHLIGVQSLALFHALIVAEDGRKHLTSPRVGAETCPIGLTNRSDRGRTRESGLMRCRRSDCRALRDLYQRRDVPRHTRRPS